MSTLKERLNLAYQYLRDQLGEASTIRGLAQAATLGGGAVAKLAPEAVLATAVIIGAVLKIVLPDRLWPARV